MKSVIAQGSTVVKAIEEALKKAGMPAQFFVKLLEDAQSGFLGFGAKKAKIALFFKQRPDHNKNKTFLSQDSYENLFDSNALSKQIEEELKELDTAQQIIKPQALKEHKPKQASSSQPTRSTYQSNHRTENKSTHRLNHQGPKAEAAHKQTVNRPLHTNKPTTHKDPQPTEQKNKVQPKKHENFSKNSPSTPRLHSKPLNQTKLTIRPILPKNNDPKKSE